MEYIAQAKDYWIAPQAVKITLNALGNPHRTQATVASGAVIMCYIKGVDGLEYDNGHQYRAWNISASPTYFNTATKKYVYAAIPRSSEVGVQAVIVYPSEILDIYGCNEAGDQVGSEHFYYIWLQGVISESAYNRADRYWLTDIDYGILATDEARDDQSYNTDWYTFNAVTQTVTFLKEIIMKAGSSFRNLILGGHNLTGVATGDTPEDIDSDTLVVTPNYIRNKFLHKDRDDTTPYSLTIEQELRVGNRGIMNHLQSTDYTGDGMLDSGYKLWYEEGRAKLVIDDLVARGKFTVNELETRIWTYAGGNMVFSGAGSTIFYVEYLDANDNALGYTYINQSWLLRGRALLAASLSWSKRRQIQRQLSDTERAAVVKFRCYEFSDDGTMQTRNWWHTNDIAMCQSLNKVDGKTNSDGSYSGALSNTVYKRRIAGIGSKEIPMLNDGRIYDYVDMWNIYDVYGQTYINSQGQTVTITDSVKGFQNMAPSGATPSTDWPAAGDVIVQMGNPLDTDRQAAVTIEVQGDVHGFKVYDTISDYSMENKLWVEIGFDKTSGKAKANIFGDAYIGARDESTYVKYNRGDGTPQNPPRLDIKANVRFTSPTTHQETNLDTFANAVVGDLSNLQSQIDGQIESWFYNYSPVHVDSEGVPDSNVPLNVAPYSDWTTDALKIAHLGDTFTNNESGYCWRFSRNATTNAFEWVIIEDSAVIKALQDAARAQDTADHKRRTFVLPVTIDGVTYNYPYPPYDVGDLWVNATYPTTGTKTYENDILKCITSKASGAFDIADWDKASDYTNDDKVNEFISELLNGASDTEAAMTTAFKAIRAAMNEGETNFYGGLILTNDIELRDTAATPSVWAGISGMYDTNAQGGGVAIWAGGARGDWEAYYNSLTPEQQAQAIITSSYAKSLFRFDGTGYLASGKISWDGNGDGYVAGGNIAWTTDQQTGETTVNINGSVINAATKIDTPAIFLNGTDITTTLNAILGMFEIQTINNVEWVHVKNNRPFYSDSDISAGGAASGGGGGGGASVLYELNDVTPNVAGNEVMGIVITDGQTTQGDGYVLTFDGSTKRWKAAPTTETYVLPQATSGALGGIKIGFSEANKNYAVQLDNAGKAYVNVPWTDHYDYIVPKSEITYNVNYLQYDDVYATEASNPVNAIGNPTADWYHHIVMNHANAGGYFVDMALCFHSNDFYYRRIANGVANDWVRVLDSSNYSSYALSKSGGTLTGALTINPSNTSSFQDGIILNDKGTGASEALTIKWTSGSYTTGVKLSADLANNYLLFHNGTAWQTIYHSGNNPFVIRGGLADAYINGTTYSTLDNGTYLHTYSGASETIIHFQRSNCSASGLDIRFKYPQDSSNPLQYRKCIDSNRFASTDWVTLIDSLNISTQSVASATKATQDGDGNIIKDTYLKLSGGTMTGILTLKGSQYDGYKTGSARTYGLNANNSDIVGVNSIIMSDKSDSWAESFGFPRDGNDAGHYDTFRAANGTFYFGFNGYYDSSNVEHAAAEVVTITGGAIQLARQDANNANLRVKNTSRDISLDVGSTNCGVYYQTGSKWLIGTNGTDTWLSTGKVGIGTTSPVSQLDVHGGSGVWSGYFQGGSNSGVYLAYADGNGIFVNSKSTSASTYLFFCGYGATQLGTAANTAFRVNCDGKVGVGVNPSYKFHVSGDIYATGDVTAASDERQKCDIEQIDLSVEQIANAPAVKFSWKDGRDNLRHVGSFAQYWQKVLPESVTDKNDILGLNYGSAALVSVKKVAEKVLTHEEEIEQLKKWYAESQDEIKAQKQRIRELEHEVERLKIA